MKRISCEANQPPAAEQKNRKVVAIPSLLLASVALSACAPDYEGSGNEFEVTGIVERVNEKSIEIDVDDMEVNKYSGESEAWLSVRGEQFIGDNYEFSTGFNKPGKHYIVYRDCTEWVSWGSDLYDPSNNPIDLRDIKAGDEVVIEGTIVDSSKVGRKACRTEQVAVIDTLKLTDSPSLS